MDPITLGILGTGLLINTASSIYTAYQSGKINKEQYRAGMAAAKKYEESLTAPPGSVQPFTPEEYQVIQSFSPKMAQYVEENKPELVTEARSQAAMSAQTEGLQSLRDRVMTGKDVIADAQQEEALFNADAQAKGRRDGILRDMSNRGMSGSGQDILAQLGSSQNAQVNARQQSLESAKQAEGRRMSALGDMTNLAGNIRSQNRDVEQNNTNIMNSYNQRLASGQNNYNQTIANTQNDADQFNIQNTARTNQMNTTLRNNNASNEILRREGADRELRDFANNKALAIMNGQNRVAAINTAGQKENLANVNSVVQSTTGGAMTIAAGVDGQRRADKADEYKMKRDTVTDEYKMKRDIAEDEFRNKELAAGMNRTKSKYN